MKLNKKGFTLIELLAVVVILLAISVIAISSISAAIERNRAKQDDAKIEVIVSYAKLYYDSHKNTESDKCIELNKLDLSDEESVDSNNDFFVGVVKYVSAENEWQFMKNGSCS